jgi:hypothetical protein
LLRPLPTRREGFRLIETAATGESIQYRYSQIDITH